MGYNTALIILNDGMDQLLKDPEAGKKIYEGIILARRDPQTISIGNHCNPIQILPSHHADIDQVILVGGNNIRSIMPTTGAPARVKTPLELQEWLLHQLASNLGYTVERHHGQE